MVCCLHGKDERDDEVHRVARVNDKNLFLRMIPSVCSCSEAGHLRTIRDNRPWQEIFLQARCT